MTAIPVIMAERTERYVIAELRARSKITLHFKRRCVLSGYVPKAQEYLDIPNLSRLARQAPQHLKLLIYF